MTDPHPGSRQPQAAAFLLRAALVLLTVSVNAESGARTRIRASDYPSLAAMEAACHALACAVEITTPQTLTLPAPYTIPGNLHLKFDPGGSWNLQGASLTLTDGLIEAPDDTRIFSGSASIHGLQEARPEWFEDPTPDGYPPSALALAYRATIPMGTIRLREAAYISPFFDPLTPGLCSNPIQPYTSPRIFAGVRRPIVDNETAPTMLVTGTILRGGICGTSALIASHLGVDYGPAITTHLFNGHSAYGISLSHSGPVHQVKGTTLDDISVLTTKLSSQHSVIIEGQDDLSIDHLWLWTLGGTHGLVIKSSNSTVRDYHCKGASSDCLIIKSDAATDNAGYAAHVLIDNVAISALQHPADTAGIVIDSRWDSVHHLTMDHIVEDQTSYGISAAGSILHQLHDVTIRNWTANVASQCFGTHFSQNVTVDHFRCIVSGQTPGVAAIDIHGDHTTLTDGTIACTSCTSPPIDGILDLGQANTIHNLSAYNLSGYLLQNLPNHNESTENLTTTGMNGRLAALYQPPPESLSDRIQRWIAFIKPVLRILYTALVTRVTLLWSHIHS